MQTTADVLAWTMQTTVEQKAGQAMQTRADGLAWTMQTTIEQKVGQAMQTRADGFSFEYADWSRRISLDYAD